MGLLDQLKQWLSPPKRQDPEFGELTFIRIGGSPDRSYWEAQWAFPPTGTEVSIDLHGGESGPWPEARDFYLGLPARFAALLDAVRPALNEVFLHWYDRPLAPDLWQDVKLSGFSLPNPRARPLEWDITFEATGKKWLGITIPFRDDTPEEPVVDT
jgi:hypothetical protein